VYALIKSETSSFEMNPTFVRVDKTTLGEPDGLCADDECRVDA
jgi:hypothetical protein